MAVRELILGLLRENGCLASDVSGHVVDKLPLFEQLLSSLQFMVVLGAIEHELGCPIADDDLSTANFDTIENIETLMRRYRGGEVPATSSLAGDGVEPSPGGP